MKRLFFLSFFILSALNFFGEVSATFSNCSWTVESDNMVLHFDLRVHGCKDQSMPVIAYFYNSDGTKLADTNDCYCTTDGQVSTSTQIKPRYDSSLWEDFTLSIPLSELHPRPGENSYYVDIEVHKNKKSIGHISKACSYKLKGSSSNSHSSGSSYASGSSGDICTGCSGTGKMTCIVCCGTGTNPIPRPIINYYTYQTTYVYDNCMMCGGTGVRACWMCNGTGKIVVPDYSGSAGNSFIVPNYGSGSGSSSSSSVYTTCSRCGGSGICHGCGGGKGSWEYIDHYTGDGTKGYIPCGECRGSGKCPICYGRGKL